MLLASPALAAEPPGLAGERPPLAAESSAFAGEEPAARYDKAGVSHDSQCEPTAGGGPVVIRDVTGAQLRTDSGPVVDPPEAKETCARAPGIRFEGIEAVDAAGMTMYYTWPLEGGQQSAGFVAGDELASAPSVSAANAAGNGSSAPPATGEPLYAVTPQDIAPEQRYPGPTTDHWYTYSVYGRPIGAAEFALMTWSWIDVGEGGIARAAVATGELFHPADVAPITLTSAAAQGQPANGAVTVRYGYVSSGSERLYGWMVTNHTFNGECYDHMSYAGGGPPLVGTLCPEGSLRDAIGDLPVLVG